MFSKLTFAVAMTATAEAVESFYPQAVFTDKASFQTAADKVLGITVADTTPCQACIMSGGEWVMTAKAEFVASEVASAKAGVCCTPGKYATADSICNITPADTMKKSTAWKQPEMALANCPNLKTQCVGNPVIDLDTETSTERVVGTSSGKMVQTDSCAYIATSKCKAPTVNVSAFTNKESNTDAATARTLWDLTYFEYTAFAAATTAETVEVSSKQAMDSSTKRLGGEMWPVEWQASATSKVFVPAETLAKWIGVSNTAYKAYTTTVTGATWKAEVDTWNYFAAQVGWLKDWLAANTGKTALTADEIKAYTDKLVKRTDAAGTEILFSPEKPMVPPLPASYSGPALLADGATISDGKFQVVGGFGKPTLGKLGIADALGTQHMYGVKGTGNLATNADADIKKDPNAVSLLYPAQPTDETKCYTSTLVVIAQGTTKQTVDGSTVSLVFKKEEFGKNPLLLETKPTATTLLPKAREAASFLAAGFATASLVAASLY